MLWLQIFHYFLHSSKIKIGAFFTFSQGLSILNQTRRKVENFSMPLKISIPSWVFVLSLCQIGTKETDMGAIRRTMQSEIEKRIRSQNVMLLFGARRVGKTVLLRQIVDE